MLMHAAPGLAGATPIASVRAVLCTADIANGGRPGLTWAPVARRVAGEAVLLSLCQMRSAHLLLSICRGWSHPMRAGPLGWPRRKAKVGVALGKAGRCCSSTWRCQHVLTRCCVWFAVGQCLNRMPYTLSPLTTGWSGPRFHAPACGTVTEGLRKGRTYGMIVVDLERRWVIDLLPDRSCSSHIQMASLCKIEMALPRVLVSREMRHDGITDEQARVQPARRVVAGAVRQATGLRYLCVDWPASASGVSPAAWPQQDGPPSLLSKRWGKASNHRLAAEVRALALSLVRERYTDFGSTFAAEKLAELHGC